MAARLVAFLYGVVCYVVFLAVFLYAIAFVGDFSVPRTVDRGIQSPVSTAVVVDLLLLSLFAIQHSVMARQWWKRPWTRLVPWPVERSTFVLLASLILALLFWQWRPIPRTIWQVQAVAGRGILIAVFWAGWGLVLYSTFLIDHFHLFGLAQTVRYFRGQAEPRVAFKTPGLYRFVRHPLYLGFILAFWSTPRMSAGHLLFAAVCTVYMLVAIQLEERDLLRFHGEHYRAYRARVPMILPWRAPVS